jgi:enoyl-CoA hydratase/carnithine racemase
MSTDHIIVSDEDGIRTIRMNRADKKNALTQAMYIAMTRALDEATRDDAIRCIVFAGVPGAFSAGNDLQEFLAMTTSAESMERPVRDFLPGLVNCTKPMVAAVSGIAVGIGTTMLFHCDHVVAADNAHFSTPFAALGLLPEAASSLLAPRAMGYSRAFSLLVMGRPLDAAQAKEAGLVNTVVPAAQVDAEARKSALEIAALPQGAVAIARKLLRGPPDAVLARIDEETELFSVRLKSAEAKRAFETFLARKR